MKEVCFQSLWWGKVSHFQGVRGMGGRSEGTEWLCMKHIIASNWGGFMAPIFSASENISSSSYTFSEQNSEFLTQSAVHSFVQICQNGERGGGCNESGSRFQCLQYGRHNKKENQRSCRLHHDTPRIFNVSFTITDPRWIAQYAPPPW